MSLGLTAREVADSVNITPAYLFVLEKSSNNSSKKQPRPSLKVLLDLAQTLQLTNAQTQHILVLVNYDPQFALHSDDDKGTPIAQLIFYSQLNFRELRQQPHQLLDFQSQDVQNFFPRTELLDKLKDQMISMINQLMIGSSKLIEYYVDPIALYGMGGIGKTTLLFKAVFDILPTVIQSKFCYVDCENHSSNELDLLQHVLKSLIVNFSATYEDLTLQHIRQEFNSHINTLSLQQNESAYIVLLDGCANRETLRFCVNSLRNKGIGVIVTMRDIPQPTLFSAEHCIEVQPFDKKESVTYFKKLIQGKYKADNDDMIEKLVDIVGCNTLAIQLLAMMAIDSQRDFSDFVNEVKGTLIGSLDNGQAEVVKKNTEIQQIVLRIVSSFDGDSHTMFACLGVFHERVFPYDAATEIAKSFHYSPFVIDTLVHKGLVSFQSHQDSETSIDEDDVEHRKILAMHTLVHFAARHYYKALSVDEKDTIDKTLFVFYEKDIKQIKQYEKESDRILYFQQAESSIYALFHRHLDETKYPLEKIKLAFAMLSFWKKYWNIHDSFEIVIAAQKSIQKLPNFTIQEFQKEIWDLEFTIFLANILRRIGLLQLAESQFKTASVPVSQLPSQQIETVFHLKFAYAQLLRTIGKTAAAADTFTDIFHQATSQIAHIDVLDSDNDDHPNRLFRKKMIQLRADAPYYLGWIELEKGNFTAAQIQLRKSLKIITENTRFDTLKSEEDIIALLRNVREQRNYSDARTLGRCLHRLGMMRVLQYESGRHTTTTEWENSQSCTYAQQYFHICDDLNEETQDEQGKLAMLLAWARLHTDTEQYREAKMALAKSETKSHELLDHFAIVYTKLLLAKVFLEQVRNHNVVNPDIAIEHAENILEDARKLNRYETWRKHISFDYTQFIQQDTAFNGVIWQRLEAIEHEVQGLIAIQRQQWDQAQTAFEVYRRISEDVKYVLDVHKADRYLQMVQSCRNQPERPSVSALNELRQPSTIKKRRV